MQEELQKIIKQLEQRCFNVEHFQTRLNGQFDGQAIDFINFSGEQFSQTVLKVKLMEQTIKQLLQCGIRMNKLYQQIIEEGLMNLSCLRQQKEESEHSLEEELNQAYRTNDELTERIEQMKKLITYQQENQRNILEKYQTLNDSLRQSQEQQQKDIAEMQLHLIEQIKLLQNIIQFKQHTLSNCLQQNYQNKQYISLIQSQNNSLKTQIDHLRDINKLLTQSEQRLNDQNKRLQRLVMSLQQKIDDLSLIKLQSKCEFPQNQRSEQGLMIEVNKSYGSRYKVNFNQQKTLLNLSQNYIQSLQSFRAKFNQSEEHIDQEIIQRSRFIKNTIFRILQQEKETPKGPDKTQEIQYKPKPQAVKTQNPYESFFTLLVQSQKLNSPHFDKVAHINLKHLFHEFISNNISFNKWQEEIKKHLDLKRSLRHPRA